MRRKCEEHSGHLIYWLCAYRYAGDMNLMQALEGNLRDPVRETWRRTTNREAICFEKSGCKSGGKEFCSEAFRKSEETIVAKKSL